MNFALTERSFLSGQMHAVDTVSVENFQTQKEPPKVHEVCGFLGFVGVASKFGLASFR